MHQDHGDGKMKVSHPDSSVNSSQAGCLRKKIELNSARYEIKFSSTDNCRRVNSFLTIIPQHLF